MDNDGNLLPTGERGEIVVRSSLVMAGYYQNPSATEEANRFGWHHTGDSVTESEVKTFVKARIGSVKAPKQVEVWPDLPRSTIGKMLKSVVKAQMFSQQAQH